MAAARPSPAAALALRSNTGDGIGIEALGIHSSTRVSGITRPADAKKAFTGPC
jgi:hypothetical protein